jgi:hypothetical protein
VPATAPTPLSTNSTSAISIAWDPVKHELTKHIGIDASYMRSQVRDQVVSLHHVPSEVQLVGIDASYMRSQVRDQVVSLHHVPSEVQLVDFFTKAQTRSHHRFLLSKLSVVDPP